MQISYPIRILHVFASLDYGGAESMIMNIYRHINQEEIQFDFIVNFRKRKYIFEDEIKKLGGRVFYIPKFKLYNYLSYSKTWDNLLKKHPEWKIIHGHHTTPAFIYLSLAKKRNRFTIAHSHTSFGEYSFKSLIKIILRRRLIYIADCLMACSVKSAEWMFGRNNKKKVVILKNAIDAKRFIFNEEKRNKIRNNFNIRKEILIGHVGRFDHAKNHIFLIKIFNEILKKQENAKLLLIGSGNLFNKIYLYVTKLGISENVIMTGNRSDISDLMQAMDIFVFPSKFEGLPITLIEAQAAGLSCVVSENITKEIKITNLIKFISLNRSPIYWADFILRLSKTIKKDNYCNSIKSHGYDISYNIDWIKKFYYEQIYKNRNNFVN